MKGLTEQQYIECCALTSEYKPRILPPSWSEMEWPIDGQKAFARRDGLFVIFTVDRLWGDEKTWIHVSMSRKNRLPSYEDMCNVKDLFIGRERQAIQLFPKVEKHINIHPYCLHLWSCIEGDGLPDFGKDGII